MVDCGYQIIRHEYGVIVKGAVPFKDFFEIQQSFSDFYGFNYRDVEIARHYDAVLCLTTYEDSVKWKKCLNIIFDNGVIYKTTTKSSVSYMYARKNKKSSKRT